jgi:pimeloyl-ACP methyl ester carboxylesterase
MSQQYLNKIKTKMIYMLLILIAWIVFAQTGMRRTMSDKRAIKEFSETGVLLHTHSVQIKNHRLHYASTGTSNLASIVFLHGSPRSWTYFKNYLKDKELLQHYRLVSIDRPGYGKSGFGNVLPLQQQAELISALLDTLSTHQPLYLVGHSMGGPLVVALAAMKPASVSGIVIIAGALNPDEEQQGNWRKIFIKTPLKYLVPGAWRPTNEESYNLKNDLRLLQNDFAKVTCFVFLVHGTKDRIVSYRNTEWASKMFSIAPEIKIIVLPNAGHYIPSKNFDELKHLLLQLKR